MADDRDLPWFKFYVRDWMDSYTVGAMSDAAIVCYLDLLCRQWVNGSIPAEPRKIAAILRRPVDHFLAQIWPELSPCFVQHPDDSEKLVNPRLHAERSGATEPIERRRSAASVAGAASAKSRAAARVVASPLPNRSTTVERVVDESLNGEATSGQQDWRLENGDCRVQTPAGASLSSSPSVHCSAVAGREREILPTEDASPDGNATPAPSKAETRPPPGAALAGVEAVRAAWSEAYRAATGQPPDWGVRTNGCASRLAAIPLPELRARMGRFFAGAPAGFWRSLRPGEFPDLLGFEHCVGRLVDAPLPTPPPAGPAIDATGLPRGSGFGGKLTPDDLARIVLAKPRPPPGDGAGELAGAAAASPFALAARGDP